MATMEPKTCPKCSRLLDDAGLVYTRDVADDPRSRGWWLCAGCSTAYFPNTDPRSEEPAEFSQAELERLLVLEILHSDEGFGTRFRDTGEIACALPVPLSLLEEAALEAVID